MKKPLLLAGLAVLVLLQAAVAVNSHLGWKGKSAAAGPEARVRVLRRAEAVYPWNAAVAAELGKAWFENGAEALADPAKRDTCFRYSAEAFLRSIRLDPGVPATHFHFAQTLLYMSYLSLPVPLPPFEEYERAARLAGHNSQIQYEVGRMMVGLWPALSAGQKDFAADILKKTLASGSEARLPGILETWLLQSQDQAPSRTARSGSSPSSPRPPGSTATSSARRSASSTSRRRRNGPRPTATSCSGTSWSSPARSRTSRPA